MLRVSRYRCAVSSIRYAPSPRTTMRAPVFSYETDCARDVTLRRPRPFPPAKHHHKWSVQCTYRVSAAAAPFTLWTAARKSYIQVHPRSNTAKDDRQGAEAMCEMALMYQSPAQGTHTLVLLPTRALHRHGSLHMPSLLFYCTTFCLARFVTVRLVRRLTHDGVPASLALLCRVPLLMALLQW